MPSLSLHFLRRWGITVVVVAFSGALSPSAHADAEQSHETAKLAAGILRRACSRCHQGDSSESGYAFNVLDVKSLRDDGVLEAGAPESSSLFEALYEGRMPPRNRPQLPRPSAADVEVVKNWIAAGAPPLPEPEPRPFISLSDELSEVISHLRAIPRDERSNWRYFTLTHLHNNATLDAATVEVTKLALVKTLNSLSWQPQLVVPQLLGGGTILAIDISRLGWTREHWNTLAAAYPYAVGYASLEDTSLDTLDKELHDLRRDGSLVMMRADWMVARGAQPPLYYSLLFDLTLPELVSRPSNTADPANPKQMIDIDLERFLGVNVNAAITTGRVARAGFTHSGVSGQNRLVERHDSRTARFYWKSYDFKSSNRTAILSEFPLGPRFDANPFNALAFEHDGGEIIFGLPNGLQGYLLVDGHGRRIDAGPIDVVGDALKTSGNEQIVAGVSCIACHRNGMIETPDDEIRLFSGVVGDARDHLRRIYPESREFKRLVAADAATFVAALDRLLGAVAGVENVLNLPEPVGEAARTYLLEPLSLETAAAELGVTPARLRQVIEVDTTLHSLGMKVLLRDSGGIRRAAWESPPEFPLMKQVARRMGYDPR